MKKLNWLLVVLATIAGCAGLFAAETSAGSSMTNQIPEATTYQIRNSKYGTLLRPKNANHANGTPIVLHTAQPWKCMAWKLQSVDQSGFLVKNLFTHKTFSAKHDGNNAQSAAVIQVPLSQEATKGKAIWQFIRLKDGNYKIVDKQSESVLTADPKGDESHIIITLEPWHDLPAQKWVLEKVDPNDLTM